jgi:hypothetical protein
MNIEQAIERSVRQRETVHLGAYDARAEIDLLCACDDHTVGNEELQFWGKTAAGHAWRVHMDRWED